jgi:hypothetical protein
MVVRTANRFQPHHYPIAQRCLGIHESDQGDPYDPQPPGDFAFPLSFCSPSLYFWTPATCSTGYIAVREQHGASVGNQAQFVWGLPLQIPSGYGVLHHLELAGASLSQA